MVAHCAVLNCRNYSQRLQRTVGRKDHSLHRFPKENELKEKWSDFVQKANKLPFLWKKSSTICSRHFLSDDFMLGMCGSNTTSTHLKKDAIPRLYAYDDDSHLSLKQIRFSGNRNKISKFSSKGSCKVKLRDEDITDSEIFNGEIPSLEETMCRICLKNAGFSSVKALRVAEKYKALTQYEIQPTDIPQKICLECNNLLEELYEFVKTCKNTENILKTFRLGMTCEVNVEEILGKEEYAESEENEQTADSEEELIEDDNLTQELEMDFVKSESASEKSMSPELPKLPKRKMRDGYSTPMICCENCGKVMMAPALYSHKRFYCKFTPNGKQPRKKRTDRQRKVCCDACGMTMSISSLYRHRKLMHNGDKTYREERIPCGTCGKFIAKHNMSVHKKYHQTVPEDEKFLCDMCPERSFNFRHQCHEHMVHYHIKPNVKTESQLSS